MKPLETRIRARHVAFIVETSTVYGRGILHGATQYVRENARWSVYLEQRSLMDPAPPWVRNWDGIITRFASQLGEPVPRTDVPTVDLDDFSRNSVLPTVQSDHEAIGAMAAEHFLERGFQHYAYFGYSEYDWSRRRRDGFAAAVRSDACSFNEYQLAQHVPRGHPSWDQEIDGVSHWIADLPKPIGMMACNDFFGVQAIDACRRANVAVPEEVAVIGVDNEILACELAVPPLSSVIPDCHRIGYEAAELLDRLMNGESQSKPRRDVPPLGIATRLSTDITAITDPVVAEAMRFIRMHACDGIHVEDVIDRVAVSRSALQRRFRRMLGRTMHDIIAGVRLQRVKELLIETDLRLPEVADRAGFVHVEYLSAAFRQATGLSPGVFRKEHRRQQR
jgi:LacI family transcriptional regulator